MFQQPGNPSKLASAVFIRVSQKYSAEAKGTTIRMPQPAQPGTRPDA